MAGSVNKVILVGNLGRDPEVKSMQDGRSLVNMSVATSETWRDRNSGERKERTEWHRVVIFNDKLAEVAQKFLKKGAKVYLEGQLTTRKWTDQSGQERYTTEVVVPRFGGTLTMLDGRSGGEGGGGWPAAWTTTSAAVAAAVAACPAAVAAVAAVADAPRRAARPNSTTTFRSRPCERSSWVGRASSAAGCAAFLANDPLIELTTGARDGARVEAMATELGIAGLVLDWRRDLDRILASGRFDAVVHVAGPFQGQDYAVAESCIRHGVHYLDLADDRAFVCGIGRLDAAAKEADVLVCSGREHGACADRRGSRTGVAGRPCGGSRFVRHRTGQRCTARPGPGRGDPVGRRQADPGSAGTPRVGKPPPACRAGAGASMGRRVRSA